MKKILITLTSFIFVFASATTIKAEDTKNTSGTQHSSASITFVEDNDTTDPINPDGGGDGDINTDSKGPLSLDVVPSFDFGTGKIQTGKQSFNNNHDISTVQVSDKRADQGNGWQLTAKMSELKLDGSNDTLEAVINFKNNIVSTTDANILINAEKPDQGPMGSLNTDGNKFDLVAGGSEKVIWGASAGKGRSSWESRWIAANASDGNEKVELNLNTNQAKVGTYKATIDWALTVTP